MVESVSEEELFKAQFRMFIVGIANSAMQQLGKIMNPLTGKIERDLGSAKATIDLIRMLQVKTKGNLSREEQQLLDRALSNLQLNYVDELNRKEEPAEAAGEAAAEEQETAAKDGVFKGKVSKSGTAKNEKGKPKN